MTTKTTITLSPCKRFSPSPHPRRRRLSNNRKAILLNKPNRCISALPDLVQDIFIEQQRRESIVNIANILRKVGDQMDEQLQTKRMAVSLMDQTGTMIRCLTKFLRLFL